MRKSLYLIAGFLGLIILLKINSGVILSDDVMHVIRGESDPIEKITQKPIERENVVVNFYPHQGILEENLNRVFENASDQPFPEQITAAVISPELAQGEKIADFFKRLAQTQEVETFILITENHLLKGPYKFATTEYGYETPNGKLQPNLELFEELTNQSLDFGSNYWAFHDEKSIRNIAPFIKKSFPDTKVFPIAIKTFTDYQEIENFTSVLQEHIDDKTVIIGLNTFSHNMPEKIAQFHDELNQTALETFDKNAIIQMDLSSKKSLWAFMEILEKYESLKSQILYKVKDAEKTHFFVSYASGEKNQDRDLTILAFGDMMLGRHVRIHMDNNGKDYIFNQIKEEDGKFFEGADIIHANLEGPIKGQGKKGGTAMNFSFNVDVAPFLKEYGFNLLSLANNHAVDQGWDGRETTIQALDEQGIGWCGHPSEAEAQSVYYQDIKGKKIAFLCFHDVTFNLDQQAALNLIKEVRPNVDYLIVSIHWGYEYKHRPDQNAQVQPAHEFIDAGADFIIGHHPHVVQTFEIYKDRFIFYSLGNFIFDQYWSVATQEELSIGIVLDDQENNGMKTKVYLYPMRSHNAQPRHMEGDEYTKWIEKFIGYGDYSEELKNQIRAGMVQN
ncbi:AmmeMemoRadiSam system protein B [Patescibacteria group bacterium]